MKTKITKILSVLLAMLLVFTVAPLGAIALDATGNYSEGITYSFDNATGILSLSGTEAEVIEAIKPTAEIKSTAAEAVDKNGVLAQDVTLILKDNNEIKEYYWGTNSDYASNDKTEIEEKTAVKEFTVSKTITAAGKYYLTAVDASGNVSETQSIEFVKIAFKASDDEKTGTVSPARIIAVKGSKIVAPTPKLENQVFVNWVCKTKEIKAGEEFTADSAYTFVAEWTPLTVTSISVKAGTAKTEYYVGDKFSAENLIVVAHYNDGSSQEIKEGFTCDEITFNEKGEKEVTVKYNNFKTTIKVNVSEILPVSIAVKSLPEKTEYFVGDTLDTNGIVIKAVNNNGSESDIVGDVKYSVTKLNTAGTQTVTVTAMGFTTTFDVKVEEVIVTKISIYTPAEKTSYFVGDSINTAGLSLNIEYNNGKKEVVSTGFEYSPKTAEKSLLPVSVEITYSGKTTSYKITVSNPTIVGISVDTTNAKTVYNIGDKLDTTDVKVYYEYSNGTKKDIPTSTVTFTPTQLNSAGKFDVTVKYGKYTTTYRISVRAAREASISVSTNPAKMDYTAGDTVNMSGLVLKVTYTDGSTELVSEGFTYSPKAVDTAGIQPITITYHEKKTTLSVTVAASEVSSVQIVSNPTKTAYHIDNQISTSGLKLKVNFTNGTSKTITSGFRVDTPDMSTAGTKTVYVNVGGKSAKYTITVSNHSYSTTWTQGTEYHWHACSCGAKKDIAKHTVGDWEISKKATYFSAGTKVRKCEYCGKVVQSATIAKLVLAAPKNVKVTAVSTTSLKVTFTKVTNATGYHIFNRTTKKSYVTTATSYTITNLKAGTKYEIFVRAYIKSGKSTAYGTWCAVNNVATKPNSTTATLKADTKQFTASWKKVSGATGYQITYATNSKFTNKQSVLSSTTSKTVTGLKSGSTYYVRVRAYIKIGSVVYWGAYSPVKAIKVK